MKIRLTGPAIEFSLSVRNQTPHQIAEVWYPILGGFTGIGDRQDSHEMIPLQEAHQEPTFSTLQGAVSGRRARTALRGELLGLSHSDAHALDKPL